MIQTVIPKRDELLLTYRIFSLRFIRRLVVLLGNVDASAEAKQRIGPLTPAGSLMAADAGRR